MLVAHNAGWQPLQPSAALPAPAHLLAQVLPLLGGLDHVVRLAACLLACIREARQWQGGAAMQFGAHAGAGICAG